MKCIYSRLSKYYPVDLIPSFVRFRRLLPTKRSIKSGNTATFVGIRIGDFGFTLDPVGNIIPSSRVFVGTKHFEGKIREVIVMLPSHPDFKKGLEDADSPERN